MNVGSIGTPAVQVDEDAPHTVLVAKKALDVERAEGQAAIDLISSANVTAPPPSADPSVGSLINTYA